MRFELDLEQRVRFDCEVSRKAFGWSPIAGTKRREIGQSLYRNIRHRKSRRKRVNIR